MIFVTILLAVVAVICGIGAVVAAVTYGDDSSPGAAWAALGFLCLTLMSAFGAGVLL